jgi:hypothetical protein
VGDGTRTRFWHDLWCRDTVLKEAFPVLFGIAREKDASVADNMEILGGSIQWDVSFVREAHDWEVDVFASFFQVLHSVTVSRDRADRLCWVPSKKGVFKVKSYLNSLVGSVGRRFPWKSVWRTQAPPRAAFFAWTAALGKILTADNLKKWKIIIMDRCYLCKRDGEFVDHLLLHCDVASILWNLVFSRFGMSWVMPSREIELSTYLLAGGRLEGQGVLRFGRWCPYVFFGVFGRRETLDVSKTWRIPWRILLPLSFVCCIFGRWPFCHPCRLAFLIFLFVFLCLLRRFLVYTSSVFRDALRFQ